MQISHVPTILIGFSFALSAMLVYEIAAPVKQYEIPYVSLKSALVKKTQIEPFHAPNLAAFSQIDERPIFNPLRKPFTNSKALGTHEPTRHPPDLTLVGVILDPRTRIAIAKARGAQSAVNLALGALIDGWQVTAIESDHILLQTEKDHYEIALQSPSAGRQPAVQFKIPEQPPKPQTFTQGQNLNR